MLLCWLSLTNTPKRCADGCLSGPAKLLLADMVCYEPRPFQSTGSIYFRKNSLSFSFFSFSGKPPAMSNHLLLLYGSRFALHYRAIHPKSWLKKKKNYRIMTWCLFIQLIPSRANKLTHAHLQLFFWCVDNESCKAKSTLWNEWLKHCRP